MLPTSSLRSSAGFTLVELMTTLSIIGILSAIASHQFSQFTQRAFDARAESDLRHAVGAEEGYYTEHERYFACTNTDCQNGLPGMRLSLDVQLAITIGADDQVFSAEAQHYKGAKRFRYSSETGKSEWVLRLP